MSTHEQARRVVAYLERGSGIGGTTNSDCLMMSLVADAAGHIPRALAQRYMARFGITASELHAALAHGRSCSTLPLPPDTDSFLASPQRIHDHAITDD